MATFLSVVFLDVDIGLFVGLGVSVILITIKDQNIDFVKLAKFDDKSIYVDENLFKNDQMVHFIL